MKDQPEKIEKWSRVASEEVFRCRVFRIDKVRNASPTKNRADDFFVIHCPAWVNVIALTPEREVVLIEQYRHGTDEVTLEIPGGMVDEEDPDPLAAGLRELREETGFVGENGRIIGVVHPNPAIQSNLCATVVVDDVRKVGELELDDNEEIATRLVPLDEIPELIRTGTITHALVVAAFHHHLICDT